MNRSGTTIKRGFRLKPSLRILVVQAGAGSNNFSNDIIAILEFQID